MVSNSLNQRRIDGRRIDGRRVVTAAAVTGIGLSGFFDGILLHQVLQWHHLLSLVPGAALRSIGNQIFADGLFHVAMYVVTLVGLFLLWRARSSLASGSLGWRSVTGGGLLGFGIWNVIDVGFFHWILGIHRIRVDVPDPMLYDVSWLALLGLVPLFVGWLLLRSGGAEGRAGAAAVTLSLLAIGAAPLASLPVPGTRTAVVVFPSGKSSASAYQAAFVAGAPILWMNPEGTMLAVRIDAHDSTARLYRAGALLVTRSPALAGCAAAIRT